MQRAGKLLARDELKDRIRLYLEENRKELRELHFKEVLSGHQLAERRSRVIDELISKALTGLGISTWKSGTLLELLKTAWKSLVVMMQRFLLLCLMGDLSLETKDSSSSLTEKCIESFFQKYHQNL